MPYTLTTWQNAPSTATPLSAANLNEYTTAINDLDTRVGVVPTAVKTANYTASAGDFVPVDTTSGSVTVTLPTAPGDKTRVGVEQVTRGGTNTVTVAAGGTDHFTTASGPTTDTITLAGQGALYQYVAATGVWLDISEVITLASLDGRYVSSVTAGDATITVGGTATAPTVKVSSSPTFSGTTTVAKFVETPVALTDAATITVDASLGNTFTVTLGGNRTMGAPSNPTDGQKIIFAIKQDATGSRTITWTSSAGGYAFGTDVTTPTLTTTASKTDYVGFIYNASANIWRCLAVARGY